MLKTISLLQRGTVQRMSDELLKWPFGVNEVLKMSIAVEHSEVPAQAFQQSVCVCVCVSCVGLDSYHSKPMFLDALTTFRNVGAHTVPLL